MEERGSPAGLRQAPRERRRRRGRAAPRGRSNRALWAAPCLNIYRGEGGCAPFRVSHPLGAAASLQMASGAAAKRGGGVHPPQGTSEVPSPFRTLPFPYLLAHGPLGAGALGPYRPRRTPYSPCGPPGQVAPPGGPPGPFRWSRYNTDNPETCPDARNRTSHI